MTNFWRQHQEQKSLAGISRGPRRFLVWLGFFLTISLLGTVGWLGYRAHAALGRISEAPVEREGGILSFLGEHRTAELKGENEGRVNILLLGMGGSHHPGGQLTDTMMVMSFAPQEGRVGLLSVPRDLYVPISQIGWGKLNSAHALAEQKAAGQGPLVAKQTVGDVLGIPIHYYVRIDFTGFVQLIDAVGGVDVVVDKAIADPLYPDDQMVEYAPFYLKAGPQHLDGKTALQYARSRETTSDFDRSRRQQQILAAVKEKVLSLGILANPKKLTELLTIAGEHIRTDLAVWEMERLAELGPTIDPAKTVTKVLDTASGGPLMSQTDERAGYIIVPRKGNFSEVQKIARTLLAETVPPEATITIQNASGKSDLGGNAALLLRGYGYQIAKVSDARRTVPTSQLISKKLDQFSETANFLKDHFGVQEALATTETFDSDFLLIIGENYLDNQSGAR